MGHPSEKFTSLSYGICGRFKVSNSLSEENGKRFRLADVIDNAIDMLLLDESPIAIEEGQGGEIEVDFELFSIALKNLLDNAIKYGKENPKLIITQKSIEIVSKGEPISDISFDKPFNRKVEDSQKGLGLGLYISANIIKKHGMLLEYRYEKGFNIFEIYPLQ